MTEVKIHFASGLYSSYAEDICRLIETAAAARGTGIAKRDPQYVRMKLENGNSVIALSGEELAGFCYIETWGHGKYVAHSGLIVGDQYRNMGLAKSVKSTARSIELSFCRDKCQFPA